MRKVVLSLLVENNFGVLSRVAGLFSRRGYNINSLTVGETENPVFSRMTIVTSGEDGLHSEGAIYISGGQIEVTSTIPSGATFSFTLPESEKVGGNE